MLASDFRSLAIQVNQEIQRTLNEGPLHQGLAEVIQFKGIKSK